MSARLVMPSVFLACLLAFGLAANAAIPKTPAGVAVDAELEIERILSKADLSSLRAYFVDRTKPANHRARALVAYFETRKSPLGEADSELLGKMLLDVEPSLRNGAVQMVGELREQNLSRQVLELASNDRDQGVRQSAIIAVRPWTRLTHLFFLEGALGAKSDIVRSEAIRSIALLSNREVQPTLVARIQDFLKPENTPIVRHAALEALKGWNRLEWESVRQIIADQQTPDSLRIYAIELSDTLPDAMVERVPTLIDIVARETSINLGWWAYKRLKGVARTDRNFILGLSRLLAGTTQNNAATLEMAAFLRTVGMKADYKEGSWKVSPR